jgi:carboxymethylenebutenolidase
MLGDGPRVKCLVGAFKSLGTGKGSHFERIDGARATLAAREDCTGKVGVIGFCLGGGFALLSAPRFDFSAASVNYGVLPRNLSEKLEGACPVVASYGKKDISLRGAAAKLEKGLVEAGVTHDVKEYPDASHSFLNNHTSGVSGVLTRVSGFTYHGPSAVDAWQRIDAFFDEHLS